jgi:hypothetical protein
VNVLNKQSWTADKGWSTSLGLGDVLTTSQLKNWPCCETSGYQCGHLALPIYARCELFKLVFIIKSV